ncbi:MAG TPA: aquaporin [Bacillota bacterium]|nr:aquaporin [Bacillota bacterium]
MFGRKKIGMIAAEFLGTAVLTAVILSVSKSNIGIPYFISLVVGLTIAGGTMVFGAVSGAHFNPAITIGLWSARRVKTLPAIIYVAAQLLGGITAYLLYTYFVNAHWDNTGHFESRVLVAEAVGAFVFALGWAAAAYNKLDAGKAAFTVGAALTVGVLIASVASAGLLNPAVALGVRSWVWGTYVLGPVLGSVIGFNLYALLFAPAESLTETLPGDKPAKKK